MSSTSSFDEFIDRLREVHIAFNGEAVGVQEAPDSPDSPVPPPMSEGDRARHEIKMNRLKRYFARCRAQEAVAKCTHYGERCDCQKEGAFDEIEDPFRPILNEEVDRYLARSMEAGPASAPSVDDEPASAPSVDDGPAAKRPRN